MNFLQWAFEQLVKDGVNKDSAKKQLLRSKQELPGMRNHWNRDINNMSHYERSEALLAARTGLGRKDEGV